jgi:hypothetical protein
MAVSAYTSDKIRIIGLMLTVVVVVHHPHKQQFAAAAPAPGQRYAAELVH